MDEAVRLMQWLLAVLLVVAGLGEASAPNTVAGEPPAAYLQDQLPPGEAFVQDAEFNNGAYGLYVQQTFKSRNVTVPRLNMQQPFTNFDDGSYLFITPRGEVVDRPIATIYDASGSLVWTPEGIPGHFYNFQVQQYKGEPHLIFWAGDPQGGHGNGVYYMYDKHYNLIRDISAGNGFGADLHSFSITPQDTVILTIYDKVQTDLATVLGRPSVSEKWMQDCLFQEIDLQTNAVLFEWRASDHFSLKESFAKRWPASKDEPWDWFHINTVEKDSVGNYLISARHLRCVAYVSGKTGEVLWRLGGESNDFKDLSEGEATRFVGQHDVHWDGEGQYITMFDNRADWEFEAEHVSKGKRIEIDLTAMTAKTNMTFVHPEKIFAFSQGSYQTQPNGNVVLGYGYTGAMTEFSPDGEVLCDMYIQPSSRFSSGDVQSYKNLKFQWTGLPLSPPDVLLEDNTLYVSWMGSTEVRKWAIEHSSAQEGTYDRLAAFEKSGFETLYSIPATQPVRRSLRVIALGADNHVLGVSRTIDLGVTVSLLSDTTSVEQGEASAITVYESHRSILAASTQDDETLYTAGVLFGFVFVGVLAVVLVVVLHARPRMLKRWVAKYCDGHGDALKGGEHREVKGRVWQSLRNLRMKGMRYGNYELVRNREAEDGS